MLKAKKEPSVTIPLTAMKCILSYPKEKKIICEISLIDMKRMNKPETLDEIIAEAELDYATGNYKRFTNAKDLINELEKR